MIIVNNFDLDFGKHTQKIPYKTRVRQAWINESFNMIAVILEIVVSFFVKFYLLVLKRMKDIKNILNAKNML